MSRVRFRSRCFWIFVVSQVGLQSPAVARPLQPVSAPEAVRPLNSLAQKRDEALTLFREQRYHKATIDLYELLEYPLNSAMAAEVHLVLGRCFEAMGMPVLAGISFRNAVRFGPGGGPTYGQALKAWAQLSAKLDDPRDLADRLYRLPADADPPDVPVLHYLRGIGELDRGAPDAASAQLKLASDPATVVGRQALYAAAIASIAAGNRDSAFELLAPLTAELPPGAGGELSPEERAISERLKDLAILGQARIRYAQQRFDDAKALYARLEPRSAYQPRARYERAWIGFWEDKLIDGLQDLAPERIPRAGTAPGSLVEEAELLAALYYLRAGQHDLADGVLRAYLDRLQPLRVALRDVTRTFGDPTDGTELLRLLYGFSASREGAEASEAKDPEALKAVAAATPMLEPFLHEIDRDREFSQALQRARRCASELEALDRQPTWWRSGVGREVQPLLEEAEWDAAEDAGIRLQSELLRYRLWLTELNVTALTLRREVTLHRLARVNKVEEQDPYTGQPLPPFDFVRPEGDR